MATLEITEDGKQRVIPVEKPTITIGRESCDVVVADPRTSRRHCTLEQRGETFILKDLDSRNGTWLDENRIVEAELRNGDVFRIGNTTLRLCFESDADGAPESVQPEATPDDTILDIPSPDQPAPADAGVRRDATPRRGQASAAGPRRAAAESGALPADLSALINTAVGQPPGRGMPAAPKDIRLLDRKAQPFQVQSADARAAGEALNALHSMLFTAFRVRATDIHVDPMEQGYGVRYRVDGLMQSVGELARPTALAVLNVIKVLCQLDIAKKNIVQEGNFIADVAARRVDFRVSLTPTVHGQKLALRILDKMLVPTDFDQLGMEPHMSAELRKICGQDAGMLIVSGPTGSGKTTTLYTVLRNVDTHTRNVVTIEDPVEYQLPGATQISIDHTHDVTFASVLRTVLRQDPDVILVGEIRDRETADMAMQAATTGHLVLTTLHARDSIGTVFRLLDLGVEPYLIANAATAAIAQRLVRILCPHCKARYRPDARRARELRLDERSPTELYTAVGCTRCMRTGFWGRAALFEMLLFNPAMRDVILTRPTIGEIRKAAGDWMFRTLVDSGQRKVLDGLTTLEEVHRVATAAD